MTSLLDSARYENRGLLGKGSFAEVYRVYDKELKRDVALKIIRKEHLGAEIVLERFKREFSSCVELRHPNIIKAFDFIASEEEVAIILEYVEACSIEDLLESGPLPLDETLQIAISVADALAYLHEEGMLHRDVKPGNVMRDVNGRVVLMDFNLVFDTAMTALTQTGFVVGTPMYLAPELICGEAYTEQADVYALGLLTWECLAGDPPEDVLVNVKDLVALGRRSLPSIEKTLPELPKALISAIDRAVAYELDERTASPATFRDELKRIRARTKKRKLSKPAARNLDTQPVEKVSPTTTTTQSPMRKIPLLLFIVLLVTLLISTLYREKVPTKTKRDSRTDINDSEFTTQDFIRVVKALKGEGFPLSVARKSKGDKKLCRQLVEKEWANRKVLRRELSKALENQKRYFRSKAPLDEKIEFFNSLVHLRRLDALLAANSGQAKCNWKLNESDFVGSYYLNKSPWHWRTGHWPKEAIRYRFEGRRGFMLPYQPKGFERAEMSLLRLAEDADFERKLSFSISKDWMVKCKEKVTLFLELRSVSPEAGFELTINEGLIVPCWPLVKTKVNQLLYQLVEFPSKLLKVGKNELKVTLKTASPSFALSHGTWRAFALFPGPKEKWQKDFHPQAKEFNERPPIWHEETESIIFTPKRLATAVKQIKEEKLLSRFVKLANHKGSAAMRSIKDELASSLELCAAVDEAMDKHATYFEEKNSLTDKAELFNSLSYIRRLDALFVTFGEPSFSGWQPQSPHFVKLHLLAEAPFLKCRDKAKSSLVIRMKHNLLEKSFVPRQVADRMSQQISFAAVFGRESHQIVEKVELSKKWLSQCEDGRAILAFGVRLCFPDYFVALSINDELSLPIWHPKPSGDIKPFFFAAEIPVQLLKEGENIFVGELHSLSLRETLRGGAWHKTFMAPGSCNRWRDDLAIVASSPLVQQEKR